MTDNPYAAPAADLIRPVSDDEALAIRQEHLWHEAALHSLCFQYYLTGLLASIGVFASVFAYQNAASFTVLGQDPTRAISLIGAIYMTLSVSSILGGRALYRRKSSARPFVVIQSLLSLLGVPAGTLIGARNAYLVFSSRSSRVLSDEYDTIINKTPKIDFKLTVTTWVLLPLISFATLGGIAVTVIKLLNL